MKKLPDDVTKLDEKLMKLSGVIGEIIGDEHPWALVVVDFDNQKLSDKQGDVTTISNRTDSEMVLEIVEGGVTCVKDQMQSGKKLNVEFIGGKIDRVYETDDNVPEAS